MAFPCLGHKPRERLRPMDDVGVGEPDERRIRREALCFFEPGIERRELSGPAFGQRRRGDDAPRPMGRVARERVLRPRGRGVGAGVVDQDDGERAGVILRRQAFETAAHGFGLVARRHDGDHGGKWSGRRRAQREPLIGAPESAAAEEEIKPDEKAERTEKGERRHAARTRRMSVRTTPRAQTTANSGLLSATRRAMGSCTRSLWVSSCASSTMAPVSKASL